jgi:hypothetical protein
VPVRGAPAAGARTADGERGGGGQLLFQFRRPWRDGSTALLLDPWSCWNGSPSSCPYGPNTWPSPYSVYVPKPNGRRARLAPIRVQCPRVFGLGSLLQLGIAIWVGSWWLVATLAAAIAIIHYVVVPREERYLEARFGAEYRDYKASVRHWF